VPTQPEGVEPAEHAGIGGGDGRSVQRTLSVLDFVAARAGGAPPGVVEIARGVGLEKSVVSRLLRTLAETRLLVRDPGLGYRIGPRLFSVAAAAQDARLVELGTRAIAALADRFGERAEIYTRTGNLAMTVATASPDSPLQVTGWIGRTYPLVSTAAGRALLFDAHDEDLRRLIDTVGLDVSGPNSPRTADEALARLSVDRERRLCVAYEEVDRGLLAVGAPIRGAGGRIIAAIALSGPLDRVNVRLDELTHELPARAAALSAELGNTGAVPVQRPSLSTDVDHVAPLEVTP